ncbi:MAG: SdrD B-like domain-containing protein [Saprospiraceae bacterium]|nr:SdrD B-like domain-containing protein [Saprospiraceae bacterium]
MEQTASVDLEKATNGQDADTFAESVIILVPNTAPIVTWTYTITNTGTLNLSNLIVTDDQEGPVCTIPFLAAGATTTCTASAPAIRGVYSNTGTVVAQPVDVNNNPVGNPVTDADPSNYVGLYINIDKEADKTEVCAGETVTFGLTMRMLGGAPGLQFRDISVDDSNLPMQLVPYSTYWVGGDTNGNGFLDFGEEFVWGYSLVYNATATNFAMDHAEVWFLGNNTGLEPMGMDQWTITVDPSRCASLGDFVWLDTNGDGLQNDGPTGIDNVTVNLLDGNGNFITSTTTDATGFYQFTGLIPGSYLVEFVEPAGMLFTPANQGANDIDSDADQTTGRSDVIVLANGDNINTIDAGLYPPTDVTLDKTFVSATLQGNGTYNVTYTVTVTNLGGPGQYDLNDTPAFDNDITINSASYTSTAPGNGGSALAGAGPWTLANDQAIVAFATHTYTLVVNVGMNLNGGVGDDIYTSCGEGNGTPQPGQGLFNRASVDTNNDGEPEDEAEDCGDLPALELDKAFVSAVLQPNGTYNVTYTITVDNEGGAGQYDLRDAAGFDNDITINSASYTSTAPGNGGNALAGTGPWTLANDQAIAANATHTYTLVVNVSINLNGGTGDDIYTSCGENNGTPQSGEGLFNRASVDTNNDGIPEDEADACGDLPSLEVVKTFISATPQTPGVYTVTYTITVTNDGGVGQYDLLDTPDFDDDIAAQGGAYTSNAPGNAGGTLAGAGPWVLANDQAIAANATHTYTLTLTVNYNISDNVGDDTYTACGEGNGTPQPGEGLFNRAAVDTDNDGIPEDQDDACGDLPLIDLALEKSVNISTPPVGTNVIFTVVVTNESNVNATGVEVTDQLPSGYTYVSHTGSTYVPGTGVWTVGNLAAGQSRTLTITATVLATGNYLNLAEVSDANEDDVDSTPDNGVDTDDDGNTIDDDGDEDDGDAATINPIPVIDLELEKSVNNFTPNVGEVINFTVSVFNRGPSTATGVIVTDQLPSGYNYVSHAGGSYNPVNGQWNIGTLAVNQTVTLTIAVSVNATGVFLNLAEVTNANEDDIDSTPDNGVDTDGDMQYIDDSGDEDDGDGAIITPNAVIDLELEKSVNVTTATVGDQVIFTVEVANRGPSTATGVVVTDKLPTGYTYFSHSFTQGTGYGAGTGEWLVGTLAANQVETLTLTATVLATGNYLNLAEVTNANEDDVDSTPDNGVDTDNDGNTIDDNGDEDDGDGATITPEALIDLELEKSVNNTLVNPGDQVIFTVTVTNKGPSTATAVEVTDELPSGYTYVSHAGGTYNPANGLWQIGTLALNQTATLTVTATVLENGDHLNLAEVTNANEDDVDSTPDNGVDTDDDGNTIDDNGDEDDGDGAEVGVICDIEAQVSNVECDDQGTSDPSDDTYSFTVVVTGVATSGSWIANDPNNTVGFYGVPKTFGPYNIQQIGNLDFFVNDAANGATCRDAVTVIAPSTCSFTCEIAGSATNATCNDNGTPSDPTDDFYTVDITATNGGQAGNWEAYVNGALVATEEYGRTAVAGSFPIGTNITVVIEDSNNPNCNTSAIVVSPPSCSNLCAIQVTPGNPICNNNGTGGNPNDDTFTISVTLTGFNTGTGWTATANGVTIPGGVRPYNTAVVLGPFPTNTAIQIAFEDNGPSNCSTTFNIPAVAPCSNNCEINATLVNGPVCNNNGTPSNPNDDTYTFSVNVSGFNTGGTWTATWNATGTLIGSYGVNTPFPAFNIVNGPVMITFTDVNDPTCQDILMIVPPPTCSNVCEIVATLPQTPVCNNSGTPADASDDTYTFTLVVNGFNTGSTWEARRLNGQLVASGSYGAPGISVGPLLIGNGAPYVLNIQDMANPGCNTQITIIPPTTCSDQCLVQIEYVYSSCYDNETPYDPSDDQFYVGVRVTGFNANGFWTTDDPTLGGTSFSGTYGAIVAFGPYPISAGNRTINIWAVGNEDCSASLTAQPTATCSDLCLIEEAVTNIRCDDNGTPTNPSDDVFYFDVTMTGVYNFSPLGWQQVFPNGTFGLSGQYGVTTTFGPYPISGGPRAIRIRDRGDHACRVDFMVNPPTETCSDACQITATAGTPVCDDNGTPTVPNDDTFTFTLMVTGINTSSSWIATVNGTTVTGAYGTMVQLGPFPIGTNVTIDPIRDADDENCAIADALVVNSPAACSDDCTIAATTSAPVCNDNGTPDNPNDDTYTFTLTVTGVNSGNNGWQAVVNGQPVTGTYGNAVTLGSFPIGTNVTITGIRDVVKGCTAAAIAVTSPAPCSEVCDLEATFAYGDCNDNGTTNTGDDTFSFEVIVTGGSGTWTASDGTTGTYGVPATFPAYPANGATITLTITDDDNPNCSTQLTIIAPNNCDNDCNVTATLRDVFCDDDGTPNDPMDDTFTFELLVNGDNLGTTWTTTVNGVTIHGVFGEWMRFGPFDIAVGDVTFQVVGDVNDNCIVVVYVVAPEPCSVPVCTITPTVTNILCNNNGTPLNTADDTYTFTVTVTAENPGGIGWYSVDENGLLRSGFYGVPVTFGPYDIPDDKVLTFTDFVNPTCTTTITVESPAPCSGTPCEIVAQLVERNCYTDNTPADPTDNTFYFSILVTGGTGTWTANNGMSGAYGEEVTSGVYPANGSIITLIITDNNNPNCTTTLSIESPTGEQCEAQCTIAAQVTNVICHDNGTPNNSQDDYFTFDLLMTGQMDGWHTDNGATGQFGVVRPFGPYPIVQGTDTDDVTFTVIGNMNPNCIAVIYVNAPEPCSVPACEIEVVVVGTPCDDNGTPSNTNDDTFSAELTITAQNGSVGWYAMQNGDMIASGFYGDVLIDGPFPASEGDVTIIFYDFMNDECFTEVTITAPDCTGVPECEISAEASNIVCQDNGTPNNPNDDTFTFDLTVNGINVSNCWTTAGGITGSYGVPVTAGPFPLGQVTLDITDCTDDLDCFTSVTVSSPAPTINCPADVAAITIEGELRDLICTDVDSMLNNPASLPYTGEPEVDGCGVVNVWFTDEIVSDGACDTTVIERHFYASTITGDTIGCTQQIRIRKANFDDVIFPADTVRFYCNDTLLSDALGNPHTDLTGLPTVQTAFGVHLLDDSYCNLSASYSDEVITICDGTYEVRRTWALEDACNPASDEFFTQIILVVDTTGPVVECAITNHFCPIIEQNILLFHTDPFDCVGTVDVPMPEVSDYCSNTITVLTQIVDLNGNVLHTILPGQPRIVFGIAIGDYYFRYFVTDGCGNATTLDCRFRVADLEEPVAICFGSINVSLGGYGLARLYTQHINNNSYDNCGVASIQVRRWFTRDPGTCEPLDLTYASAWGPYVQFGCCDAGQYVMVEMLVTDIHGNTNTCWLNVLVEDKTLPYCTGLVNETVSCDDLPDNFNAYDTLHLQQVFGVPTVVDNCSAEAIELAPIVNLSDCGYGTITRRFVAIDAVGNLSLTTFQQVVTIVNSLNYEIRFPKDTTVTYCEDLDTVWLRKTACDSITVTHVDERLSANEDECYRIKRTYHVINHCEWNGISAPVVVSRDEDCDGIEGDENIWVLRRPNNAYLDRDSAELNLIPLAGTKGTSCDGTTNPNGLWKDTTSTGYWIYTQYIYVIDTILPEITFTAPAPFCTDSVPCEGWVSYPVTLNDNCTLDSLVIRIQLDANANGSIDATLDNDVVLRGAYPNYRIEGYFPIGNHRFIVRVVDGCNNSVTATLPFEVVDCYIPDPVCFSGMIVNLQPVAPNTDADGDGDIDDAAVTIYAVDLASCEVEECSNPIRFSLNLVGETPDINQTSLVLTCDDRYSVIVEVYVWDSAFNPYSIQPDGTVGGPNHKHCEALVLVQDFADLCRDCDEVVMLGGTILTETGKPIEDVVVEQSGDPYELTNTEEDGLYGFTSAQLHRDYTIIPSKDGDYLNGVTTLDAVLIQRHILGIQPLNSPYKLIAADVNNSGTITTIDMIQLRKLVLGTDTEFANNSSWRFVDSDYEFPVPTNPWFEAWPEVIQLEDLSGCQEDLDFIGIKIGDVNNTAVITGNLLNVQERTNGRSFLIETEDRLLKKGETVEVTLTTAQLATIFGYQFTLNFDADKLEWVSFGEGLTKAENVGLHAVSEGALTTSWHWNSGRPNEVGKVKLFSITLRAKADGRLSEWLHIGSTRTNAEAYNLNFEPLGIMIRFNDSRALTAGYELYQNKPNPFGERTVIGFDLPQATNVTLVIHDISGKVLRTVQGDYESGYNQVVLDAAGLPLGILYYTLKADQFRATRKMVLLD